MKMTEYFGYKVALNQNNKNKRAIYRFAKHDSICMDLSFFEILKISGRYLDIIQTIS